MYNEPFHFCAGMTSFASVGRMTRNVPLCCAHIVSLLLLVTAAPQDVSSTSHAANIDTANSPLRRSDVDLLTPELIGESPSEEDLDDDVMESPPQFPGQFDDQLDEDESQRNKRAPSGFMGMRGELNLIQYICCLFKEAQLFKR